MKIIVGITGGIAAYKVPQLVRLLVKAGHEVQCVATAHALEFVTRLTLETVSGRPLYSDLFAPSNDHTTEHVSLKDWGDAMVVAPATANVIGKLAAGIGDDALSTLLLAFSRKPLLMAPAMNTQMWECPSVERNIAYLRSTGVEMVEPGTGALACGTEGKGRMAEPEEIVKALHHLLRPKEEMPLWGKRVLVTAGPTYERIDAVRFIGNYSSGKMGFAVAEALAAQGAEVELVTGPTQMVTTTAGIHRHDVECAREMLAEATRLFPTCVGAILTAAVADYRPEHTVDHKLKKQGDEGMTLRLVQNPDILATLGTMKQAGQTLVGFALETDNEETNARGKMERKNADYIVLNSLRDKGAGFGVETNRVTIMSREGEAYKSALMSKREVADLIVERCLLK